MNEILQKKTMVANTFKGDVGKTVPAFNIEQLLGDFREVRLHHCNEEYRLALTKNNKLILTK
ncbi:MAG: hemin uptake protein HemP [Planctomycetes bacterium]|nr:hemin uptake protein HemP [Planctomycetota bacterium]